MRPEWGEALMFTDTATMFNPNSALVVEFYPSSTCKFVFIQHENSDDQLMTCFSDDVSDVEYS